MMKTFSWFEVLWILCLILYPAMNITLDQMILFDALMK